jgi:hypothetical protein
VGVDRGFLNLRSRVHRNGFGMTVVSDGFDIVIEPVLRSAGSACPFTPIISSRSAATAGA